MGRSISPFRPLPPRNARALTHLRARARTRRHTHSTHTRALARARQCPGSGTWLVVIVPAQARGLLSGVRAAPGGSLSWSQRLSL